MNRRVEAVSQCFLVCAPELARRTRCLDRAPAPRRRRERACRRSRTHGRRETEALLEGLPIVPRRILNYKGVPLQDMDLDRVLELRPEIGVVDELAHTNIPGSRHPKRYQDVLELLDAGISVYTTVNVQHVESRVDIVRQITGVTVRETVPDSVLDRADEIQLVDLTPEQLRQRLGDGKVYLGEMADAAAANFFEIRKPGRASRNGTSLCGGES